MKFNFEKEKLVSRPVFDVSRVPTHEINSFVLFSPSLVSESLTAEVVDVHQTHIQTIFSDVGILFRMFSGAKLDPALAEELLSRMGSSVSDEVSDLIDKMSDDEILEGVRSKYIQTPAQLEEYIRSLDSRLDELSSQEFAEVIDSSDTLDNVVDNPSPAPGSSSE